MVRAAAKNHPSVAVVVDPLGYDGVLAAVRDGGFTLAERKKLASLAFQHTAEYDVAVASWMESALAPEHPPTSRSRSGSAADWRRAAMLRYGENPHQQAALYRDDARVAGPGAGRAAARKRDVLQQLHRRRRGLAGRFRPRRDLRGDHQARQPVRHRDLVGVGRRRAPQGPRMRPAERVRRSDRRQHRSQPWRWPSTSAPSSPRSSSRPPTRRSPGSADPQEEHPRAGGLRTAGRRHRAATDQRRTAGAAARRSSTRTATTRSTGRWRPAHPPTRRRWPTWSSRGGPAARSSPTRS